MSHPCVAHASTSIVLEKRTLEGEVDEQQRDVNLAKEMLNEVARRETDPKKLENLHEKAEEKGCSKEQIDRHNKWCDEFEPVIHTEAMLQQVVGVTGIKFDLTKTSRDRCKKKLPKDGMNVRGRFWVITSDEKGNRKKVGVNMSWIKENVLKEVLDAVVQLAVTQCQEHVVKRKKSKTGKDGKSIEWEATEKESGFFNLDKKMNGNQPHKLDNQEVAAIRWAPPRTKCQSDSEDEGKETEKKKLKELPGIWHGKVFDPEGKAHFVKLTEEWVHANFEDDCINMVKEACAQGDNGCLTIWEGDHENNSNPPPVPGDDTFPTLKCRQFEHERLCVIMSAASAFHHLGHHDLARDISVIEQSKGKIQDDMNVVKGIVDKHLKHKLNPMKAVNQKRSMNLLNEHKHHLVCLVALKGWDGKRDHAVTVADGKIFDCNLEKAIPMCKENLDHCCSADGRPSTFEGVTKGWLFQPHKWNTNKKWAHQMTN